MSVKSDKWIRRMAQEHKMIEPFCEKQVADGLISYGLSSYGYDIRIADEFKIFTNIHSATVDPKNFDTRSFIDVKADVCIIPPNSFALARTIEYFRIPIHLAVFVNPLTSLLGAVTLLSYVLVYTPLKRVTTLNTAIGAIPGALPPLMGWTAARDSVSLEGWALFAILFFWQLPHFLAIAWLYREEYAKAGFVMLPSRDPDGVRTGRQAVSHTLGLIAVTIIPHLYTYHIFINTSYIF